MILDMFAFIVLRTRGGRVYRGGVTCSDAWIHVYKSNCVICLIFTLCSKLTNRRVPALLACARAFENKTSPAPRAGLI